MLERFNEVKTLEESCENFYANSPEFLSPNGCGTPNGISPFSPSLSPTSSSGGPSPSPIERKTSLGVACQKFLMLFLIAPEVCILFTFLVSCLFTIHSVEISGFSVTQILRETNFGGSRSSIST